MYKNYLDIFKTTVQRDKNLYTFKTEAASLVLLSYISYFFTPFFIILKIKPNLVTGINFLISLITIYCFLSLDNNLFIWGIFFYFLFRILDFSDGSVARFNKLSTFYGRLLDSILDIFFECFLFISLSYFIFNLYDDKNILIAGYIVSIFAVFSSCIHDKYSSLVRWSNEENRTKIIPYLRKNVAKRIGFLCSDFQQIFILILPFLINNLNLLSKFYYVFVIVMMLNYIQNIFKHIFYARKNLSLSARDKKSYSKRKKNGKI